MQRQVAIAAVLVVALVAAVWLWFGRAGEPAAPPEPVAAPTPAAGAVEAPQEELPPALPSLEASDTLLRDELFALGVPEPLAGLMEQQDIVRTLVVSANAVAAGRSPRGQLRFLEPEGYFDARSEGGALVVDPASYRRYDPVAAATTSVEATAAARSYLRLEPLFDQAYAELGTDGSFRPRLIEAIEHLLDAPILRGPVELEDAINRYRFADPELEALSDAQKQLIRTGPENQERLQRWLRAFRDAVRTAE